MVSLISGSLKIQAYALSVISVIFPLYKKLKDAVLGQIFCLKNVFYVEEKAQNSLPDAYKSACRAHTSFACCHPWFITSDLVTLVQIPGYAAIAQQKALLNMSLASWQHYNIFAL